MGGNSTRTMSDRTAVDHLVFLHRRRSRQGERLVAVLIDTSDAAGGRRTIAFTGQTILPAVRRGDVPKQLVPSGKLGVGMLAVSCSTNDRLIVNWGQPDLLDESHFTFEFFVNDHLVILDGWLMANDGIWFCAARRRDKLAKWALSDGAQLEAPELEHRRPTSWDTARDASRARSRGVSRPGQGDAHRSDAQTGLRTPKAGHL